MRISPSRQALRLLNAFVATVAAFAVVTGLIYSLARLAAGDALETTAARTAAAGGYGVWTTPMPPDTARTEAALARARASAAPHSVSIAALLPSGQQVHSPAWTDVAAYHPPSEIQTTAVQDGTWLPVMAAAYTSGEASLSARTRLRRSATPEASLASVASENPPYEATSATVQTTEAAPPVTKHSVTVHRGDSLHGLLRGVDIPYTDSLRAVERLEPTFDPSRLGIGSRVVFVIDTPVKSSEEKAPSRLLELRIIPRGRKASAAHAWLGESYEDREVIEIVDGMAAIAPPSPDEGKSQYLTATVSSNFYRAATEAGINNREASKMVKVLNGSIDFRRDLRRGDRIEALITREGDGSSTIHFMGLHQSDGHSLAFYRVAFADGSSGYYDGDGNPYSNLISTRPLGNARVTSGYGYRIHPIHKVRHLHRGADYRAAPGTPIPAAGNGVVVQKGWRGGYGRYLRIRHNSTFMTAYAHMKGFAEGIKVGSRVKQGQTIGYVGSSGQSTGPHLHFEVIRDGRHVDPLKLQRVPAARLVDERLETFQVLRAQMDTQLEASRERRLASLP